jgi:mono/diheme cytochrome c family protein
MINQKKSSLFNRPKFWIASGFIFALASFAPLKSSASVDQSDISISIELLTKENIFLAQHGGPPEGRGHGGRGRHCSEMGHEKNCPGGKGMGHRGGMGMHHGGGSSGTAECPQPRTTLKAPDELYNRVNPLANIADNIEKGRLLFQIDVQPSCVMCHGSKGDGTGGFGTEMTPKPRNFTCTETMQDIPDGQLFGIIQNGSPNTGMPPFQSLRDEQIWQLILYLRSLAK